MSIDAFERLVLLAYEEHSQHKPSLETFSDSGWEAFHLLKDYQFCEARKVAINGLKGAWTPGQLADLREKNDSVFAEAGHWATTDQMAEIVKIIELQQASRLRTVDRVQYAYHALENLLSLYRILQKDARNSLYRRLKGDL